MRTWMLAGTIVVLMAGCKDESKQPPGGGTQPRGESKTDLARITVKKYAFEAYPQWSMAHADKECPATLGELDEYMNGADTKDPWGQPYRMMCGPTLPKGARGLAVLSLGEDGKEATADDIKSWE